MTGKPAMVVEVGEQACSVNGEQFFAAVMKGE